MRSYRSILLLLALSLSAHLPIYAQFTFASIYRIQDKDNRIVQAESWEKLQAQQRQLQQEGLQIIDVEVIGRGKQQAYWSIFSAGEDTARLDHAVGWDSLVALNNDYLQSGWALFDVEGYSDYDGTTLFAGVWKRKVNDQEIWKLKSWNGVDRINEIMNEKDYYLQDIEALPMKDGTYSFLLIFQKGFMDDRTHLMSYSDAKSFLSDRLQRQKSGYQLKDFETFHFQRKQHLVGIYEKSAHTGEIRNNLSEEELAAITKEMTARKMQPVDLEVFPNKGTSIPPVVTTANYIPEK